MFERHRFCMHCVPSILYGPISLHCMENFYFWRRAKSNRKMNKKTREKHIPDKKKEKTKEQNINEVQSFLGGPIGLPEHDRAWTYIFKLSLLLQVQRLVVTHLTTTTSQQRSSLKLPSLLVDLVRKRSRVAAKSQESSKSKLSSRKVAAKSQVKKEIEKYMSLWSHRMICQYLADQLFASASTLVFMWRHHFQNK